MKITKHSPNTYIKQIANSKSSIYDKPSKRSLIPSEIIEEILKSKIVGLSLFELPLRTRSKTLKQEVCKALGYQVPESFKKTHPRFPNQNFDTYIQKSNNLQIWNEEIEPTRRYILFKVNSKDKIENVRVLTGQELALLDTTGTLTTKYQARLNNLETSDGLLSNTDTQTLLSLGIQNNTKIEADAKPTDLPTKNSILPIGIIFEKLHKLVGTSFPNQGHDQERNRGAYLHKLICKTIGYQDYRDNGKFPDILNQLLEVKLQTSPTIDLGLISPDSKTALDIPPIKSITIHHLDIRYAIFYGNISAGNVVLTKLYLTTGEKFFDRFNKFQGKIINAKIQIPLPGNFFG